MENMKIFYQFLSMEINIKKSKYSLRAKIISTIHVINAKAVGYDPTSVSKKLVSILEKRIKTERGKRIKKRYQQNAKDSIP